MNPFAESNARLSEKSYDPYDDRLDTSAYRLMVEVERPSGYRGSILQNKTTGDYVVANTDTEFDTDNAARHYGGSEIILQCQAHAVR